MGKKYVFEVEPRDSILKANMQMSDEKQHKALHEKIQNIIDERLRLRDMQIRMKLDHDQENMIRMNKLKHAELINEQIKYHKQNRDAKEKNQWKHDRPNYFPFTHGDQIEFQRKKFEEAIKNELINNHELLNNRQEVEKLAKKETFRKLQEMDGIKSQLLSEEKKFYDL